MFFLTGACQSSGFLKIVWFILQLLNIAFIVVPIGLIIMITMDFFKSVIADLETMTNNLKLAIKRILFCVVIFFLPTIVNLFIGVLDEVGIELGYSECIANANLETIKAFEAAEKLNKKDYTYVPDIPGDKVSNRKMKASNDKSSEEQVQKDSSAYITLKIDKSSLSSGGSANVVVKVKNTNKKKDFLGRSPKKPVKEVKDPGKKNLWVVPPPE